MPGSPERTSHIGAIQVFPQIHQRQKSAEDPGLQVIGQVQPAGCNPRQPFAMFGDETHDFALAILGRIAKGRLPAHLSAAGFYGQREVEYTELLFGECRRRVVLASRDLARCSHGTQGRSTISSIPSPENPVRISGLR